MSRPKRWAAAVEKAESAFSDLSEALQELDELRSEYEEWHDNLPENLDQSPVAEKLEAIIYLEFENAGSEVDEVIQEAANADLPLGFGRD